MFACGKARTAEPPRRGRCYPHCRNNRSGRANRYDRPARRDAPGKLSRMRINRSSNAADAVWLRSRASAGGACSRSTAHAGARPTRAARWPRRSRPTAADVVAATAIRRRAGAGRVAYFEPSRRRRSRSPTAGRALLPTCNGGGGGCGGYPYNRCGCSSRAVPVVHRPRQLRQLVRRPALEVSSRRHDHVPRRRRLGRHRRRAPASRPTWSTSSTTAPAPALFVTGYNDTDFGLQVGYEGVNDFHADALFSDAAATSRTIDYESNLNSLEVNFMRRSDVPLEAVRRRPVHRDRRRLRRLHDRRQAVPPPADPPTRRRRSSTRADAFLLDNRMIGFQVGAVPRRLAAQPLGDDRAVRQRGRVPQRLQARRTSTGPSRRSSTATTSSTPENEFSQVVTRSADGHDAGVLRDGVRRRGGRHRRAAAQPLRGAARRLPGDGDQRRGRRGIDAFLAPGLDPTTLVYHGGHFGVEYER